jgi:hypothetical protein
MQILKSCEEGEMGKGNNTPRATHATEHKNRGKRNRLGTTTLQAAVKRRTYLESRWSLTATFFCRSRIGRPVPLLEH